MKLQAPIANQQSALSTIKHQQEKYNKIRKMKKISPKKQCNHCLGSFPGTPDQQIQSPPFRLKPHVFPSSYKIFKDEPKQVTLAPPSDMLIETVRTNIFWNKPTFSLLTFFSFSFVACMGFEP